MPSAGRAGAVRRAPGPDAAARRPRCGPAPRAAPTPRPTRAPTTASVPALARRAARECPRPAGGRAAPAQLPGHGGDVGADPERHRVVPADLLRVAVHVDQPGRRDRARVAGQPGADRGRGPARASETPDGVGSANTLSGTSRLTGPGRPDSIAPNACGSITGSWSVLVAWKGPFHVRPGRAGEVRLVVPAELLERQAAELGRGHVAGDGEQRRGVHQRRAQRDEQLRGAGSARRERGQRGTAHPVVSVGDEPGRRLVVHRDRPAWPPARRASRGSRARTASPRKAPGPERGSPRSAPRRSR
jgi:hypothetical protein